MTTTAICPCCGKPVGLAHFSCHAGQRVGKLTGKSKRRGTSEYYRAIQAKSAATRKRNNAARRKRGETLR